MLTKDLKQRILTLFFEQSILNKASLASIKPDDKENIVPIDPKLGFTFEECSPELSSALKNEQHTAIDDGNALFTFCSKALDKLARTHIYLFGPTNPLDNNAKKEALMAILEAGVNYLKNIESAPKKLSSGEKSVKDAWDNAAYKALEQVADKHHLTFIPTTDYYQHPVHRFKKQEWRCYQNILPSSIESQLKEIEALLPLAKDKLTGFLNLPNNSLKTLEGYHHSLLQSQAKNTKNSVISETAQLETKRALALTKVLLTIHCLENEAQLLVSFCRDGVHHTFYELNDKAGGQTEKFSLLSLEKCASQLQHITDASLTSLKTYTDRQEQYHLNPNAILKLPKQGSLEALQNEAGALALAHMLGLHTTDFYALSLYEGDLLKKSPSDTIGKALLFIPFNEGLIPLHNFAIEEIFHAALSKKTYSNHSTFVTLGEGLEKNHFIPDLGGNFAYTGVCADGDSIGAYNQNKGFTLDHSLGYLLDFLIFDQSIQSSDHFERYPGYNHYPNDFAKYNRHLMGRNFLFLNDCKKKEKYRSILKLFAKEPYIKRYFEICESKFIEKITALREELDDARQKLVETTDGTALKALKQAILSKEALLSQIGNLKVHNQALMYLVRERIQKQKNEFFGIMQEVPQEDGDQETIETLLRKARIIEKAVHGARLYNHLGNPYRVPFANKRTRPYNPSLLNKKGHTNRISNITISKENSIIDNNNIVHIHFEHRLQNEKNPVIIKLKTLIPSLKIDGPSVFLTQRDLLSLKEVRFMPEHGPVLGNLSAKAIDTLLDPAHIAYLAEVYNETEKSTKIITNFVDDYLQLTHMDEDNPQMLQRMETCTLNFEQSIEGLTNKGFAKHLFKNVQLHYQQRLLRLVDRQTHPFEEKKPLFYLTIPLAEKQIPFTDKQRPLVDKKILLPLMTAFNAARKFDRMVIFNQVVSRAIEHSALEHTDFQNLLVQCCQWLETIKDHYSAVTASQQLQTMCEEFLLSFSSKPSIIPSYL
ncbi:MAG: hypothetical protein H2069_05600 [Legionella sp.]|nr:hypothetical protein [Legionella sp.]